MSFHQDPGTPRPTYGRRRWGQPEPLVSYPLVAYHRCHLPNCKWNGQPLGSATCDPTVPHSMQFGGPGLSTAGPYGQGSGYYSQRTRPPDHQLVSFRKGEWPLGQELPWGEAVIYCPRRAPCFQKDSPYCQATAPSGQNTPNAQGQAPQNEAPAPQEAGPSADTGGTRASAHDHGASSRDMQPCPHDDSSCRSNVQSNDDESEDGALSDMEVDSSAVPVGQPSTTVAALSSQMTTVQIAGNTQATGKIQHRTSSRRKRNYRRVHPYPRSKKKQLNTRPGPTGIQGTPVAALTIQILPASQPVAPSMPGPQPGLSSGATQQACYQQPCGRSANQVPLGQQPVPPKGPTFPQGSSSGATRQMWFQQLCGRLANQVPLGQQPVPPPQQGLSSGATQQAWYQQLLVTPNGLQSQGAPALRKH